MQRARRLGALVAVTWGLLSCQDREPRPGEGPPVTRVAAAATVGAGFTDQTLITGYINPTAMAFAPDGRLFVCEQAGSLRVAKNGVSVKTPFVTLSVDSSGERGLLGVAFDPNFASNQFVYVYYTVPSPAHNRVSRFTANGDVAVPGSETILLELDPLSTATNHNGGALHFGKDGKLYIAVGENANTANAQTLSNLLGKMLRINADGSIPTDNPFFNMATGKNRAIWALGLRNPFTFDIQPGTGRIFIDDVGQSSWEEINDGIAGSNYGWPTTEGATTDPRFRSPLYAYDHSGGQCAITGGAFYNPPTATFPASYVGTYFFADFCANWIRNFNPATGAVAGFATAVDTPVDLKVGPDGALYYLSHAGSLGRIQAGANQAPSITSDPANQTVAVGQPATFSVGATGSQPLSYQWQRGTTNIAGATSQSYTLMNAQASDSGATFRVIVTNAFGSATSKSATLTVTSNTAPTATITAPAAGTTYRAGATINFAGTGTDAEDGNEPASRFTWEVVFHHDMHTHPFIQPFSGVTSGSFVIPDSGETSANVWYRIHLTVTDAGGLTSTTFRDVTPQTAPITLQTSPAGLQVTLDGQPTATPATVTSVVGMQRTLGVVSPQSSGGQSYTFSSWSDGGAATHTIASPAAATTYTATYQPGFAAKINFQPAGAPVPAGYQPDAGDLFGARGNGMSYGWNVNHTDATRDRNINPDQRLDTICHMHAGGKWELAVANGTYDVLVSVGDPLYASSFTINVEGVSYWSGLSLQANQFASLSKTVTVSDGRLTVDQGAAGEMATRIDYIEITQAGGAPPPPPPFSAKINFQPAGVPVPAGYATDAGDVFGVRANGTSYGWNVSHTDVTRDRDLNPDQRLDTICHMHAGAKWEIAVPNGSYDVLVSVGDPGFASVFTINVEGVSYWNRLNLGTNQFANMTKTVTVSDGRITIDQGASADKETRIDYVEVTGH